MKTAIDALERMSRMLFNYHDGAPVKVEDLQVELKAALNSLKSLEGQGWVSVKDRLPETGLTVLVWSPTCLMHSMRYYPTSAYPWRDNDPKDEGSFSTIPDVTYWQPLPAPPTTQYPTTR